MDPRTAWEAKIKQLLDSWDASELEPAIKMAASPTVAFHGLFDPSGEKPSLSFLGGTPLPHSVDHWPAVSRGHLPFIAQLDLSDVPAASGSPLPESGLLQFYSANEESSQIASVVWIPHFDSVRVNAAQEIPSSDQIIPDWRGIRQYERIGLDRCFWAPSFSMELYREALLQNPPRTVDEIDQADAPNDLLIEVLQELGSRLGISWGNSLGYTFCEDLLGMRAIDGMYSDNGSKWVVLLRVPSVGNMMWSDAGFLLFLIQEDALARRDFGDVRVKVLSS